MLQKGLGILSCHVRCVIRKDFTALRRIKKDEKLWARAFVWLVCIGIITAKNNKVQRFLHIDAITIQGNILDCVLDIYYVYLAYRLMQKYHNVTSQWALKWFFNIIFFYISTFFITIIFFYGKQFWHTWEFWLTSNMSYWIHHYNEIKCIPLNVHIAH